MKTRARAQARALTSVMRTTMKHRIFVAAVIFAAQVVQFAAAACVITPDSEGRVTIPKSTTAVANFSFEQCQSLTSVDISNSVTVIGKQAFRNCQSLSSIEFGDSVTLIGEQAFQYCTSLKDFRLPGSVTAVGDQAFYGCTSLAWMTLSDSLTAIGYQAFAECSGLKSFAVSDSLMVLESGAFLRCSALTAIVLPDTLLTLGSGALWGCTALTSLLIPDSVVNISTNAFSHCSSLSTVSIGDSVTHIGLGAFSSCTNLTSITIPDSVVDLGEQSGGVFASCTNLTTVTLPDSISAVPAGSFYECSNLSSIVIPDSVSSFGDGCFQLCGNLSSVVVGNSITHIGHNSFGNCSALPALTVCPSASAVAGINETRNCTTMPICSRLSFNFSQVVNGTCFPGPSCDVGVNYQSQAPTSSTGRVCGNSVVNCTPVAGISYQLTPPTMTTNSVCTRISNCTLGVNFQARLPTLTTDRVCDSLTNCSVGVNFESVAPTLTTDRLCGNNVTNCTFGVNFQSVAPTVTTDRVCDKNVSICAVGVAYQVEPPTLTSNRVCDSVANCTLGVNYQSAAPTITTNRVCGNQVANCTLETEYQSAAPTLTTDRVCKPVTTCQVGHVVLSAPTMTTDRTCSAGAATVSLSNAKIIGIVVGVLGFLLLSGAALFVIGRRLGANDRQRVEEAEMQLLSARQESAESEATVRRILAAWEIPEDHLTFVERLAEGTFGVVWKGLWGSQPVAIKVLKRIDDDFVAEEWRKECEALQSIKHPNLIVFLGAGTTAEGMPFMVTELMAGGSLRTALHDTLRRIGWRVRVRIAQQIAAGMRHLHSLQMVHRDLKSDNVLLDADLNAKVADFGTSRMLNATSRDAPPAAAVAETTVGPSATMTRAVGTALWMAPEVYRGDSKYGPEVDVYSFGIIMWELITRKPPWSELGATDYISQFRLLDEALRAGRRPSVPEGFEDEHSVYVATMRKCWATKPTERPGFDSVVSLLSLVPAASPTRIAGPAAGVAPLSAPGGLYATVDARMGSEELGAAAPQIYE